MNRRLDEWISRGMDYSRNREIYFALLTLKI